MSTINLYVDFNTFETTSLQEISRFLQQNLPQMSGLGLVNQLIFHSPGAE